MFTLPKRRIQADGGSDAAPTDRGYCWGENEHLYGPTRPRAPTTEEHIIQENLDSRIKTIKIKRDGEEENGKGSSTCVQSLRPLNFAFPLLSRGVQSVLSSG